MRARWSTPLRSASVTFKFAKRRSPGLVKLWHSSLDDKVWLCADENAVRESGPDLLAMKVPLLLHKDYSSVYHLRWSHALLLCHAGATQIDIAYALCLKFGSCQALFFVSLFASRSSCWSCLFHGIYDGSSARGVQIEEERNWAGCKRFSCTYCLNWQDTGYVARFVSDASHITMT